VRQEATPAMAERLRAGTYLLLGLRYPEDMIDDLLQGVGIMAGALKESSTYQKILREGLAEGRAQGLAEGRAEEARRLVVRLGSRRFGPPDARTTAALDRLSDPEQLEELAERVLHGESWADLGLVTPDL
jgi:predicted transposase YdaD